MKTSATFILTTALLAGNAFAQGSPPDKGQPPATKPGMITMGTMDMNKQMPQMQENMKKMQVQMERMHKTTDVAERRKLMQEHMQSMREGMDMMRGMGGPMMMGGMSGAKGGGINHGMMGNDPKQRQEMMERRMDMMQMMLDQMLMHQQMTPPAPVK